MLLQRERKREGAENGIVDEYGIGLQKSEYLDADAASQQLRWKKGLLKRLK